MRTEYTRPLHGLDPGPVISAFRAGIAHAPRKVRRTDAVGRTLGITAIAACLGLVAYPLHAAVFSERFDDRNLVIPDGSPVGVSDTQALPSGLGPIVNVEVSLEIVGGYTGDLFAMLMHDGASAILLNRPGRREGDSYGYADVGLDLTFSDGASADVNNYRITLQGSHEVPLGGALTGLWQPDARAVDPGVVLDTDSRSAFLNVFAGDSAEGAWTLYVADLSPVGEATFKSWSLSITTVPEPRKVGIVGGLGLLVWAGMRGSRPPRRF